MFYVLHALCCMSMQIRGQAVSIVVFVNRFLSGAIALSYLSIAKVSQRDFALQINMHNVNVVNLQRMCVYCVHDAAIAARNSLATCLNRQAHDTIQIISRHHAHTDL